MNATTSTLVPGGSSTIVCSAVQMSIPAPTVPDRAALPLNAAGAEARPLRPRNSVRSVVHADCRPARSANATRPGNAVPQALRTKRAPVAASISVVSAGVDDPRVVPSTHSTYDVTDRRRVRVERLRSVRRVILIGSSTGTYCSWSSAISFESCVKRL